ncbi:MAG: DEAD/DEAH box helicase [Anaerolineae bacterium]|nr:DEAD/DEAH box helicase [Anaerolineae bacterium]MBT7991930.1 DEAD/DEAH box helicase [Anaerolineae bacterium]
MDVFDLRNSLVKDYEAYTSSFINIRNPKIKEYVDEQIAQGLLWPDPLIQLNPSFKPANNISTLAAEGILHPECKKIFRTRKNTSEEKELRLHQHQEEAIRIAKTEQNYILTTGTGSGKSLAYIVPIVDRVLRRGSGKGIQAIIVYPMNALANSQLGELEKFINLGYPNNKGPVTFARFTGQESDEQKNAIRQNPPDILLTNYVMLELLLTRPEDRQSIIRQAQGLQFLVLDELHTYRGRQGADVAMLIRRLREAVNSENLQCVGTSATLASGGSFESERKTVAEVASIFFGAEFKPNNIIGETLERATKDYIVQGQDFTSLLTEAIRTPSREFPDDYLGFKDDPVASWIESTFGVYPESGTDRLKRAQPISITGEKGAAQRLADLTNTPPAECEMVIKDALMKGYQIKNPDTDFPVFAFRLHQFISPGDTIYASLEAPDTRHITVNYQQYVPGDRGKTLLPLVFCRECGQEYYNVRVSEDDETGVRNFELRDYGDLLRGTDAQPGYIYISETKPWPKTDDEILENLPDDWIEFHRGEAQVKRSWRKNLPEHVTIDANGWESTSGKEVVFIKAPFRFCISCGIAYGSRQQSDFGKLAVLSAGGRSTSTTILGLSTIRHLQQEDYLEQKARKLLSFTDNRQDAALQAGHFNCLPSKVIGQI